MGWSCASLASDVLDAWTKACLEQTGVQNVYETPNGKFMWEHSRTEHDDGAITGSVWRFYGEHIRRSQNFKVNGDGTVAYGPKELKKHGRVKPPTRSLSSPFFV